MDFEYIETLSDDVILDLYNDIAERDNGILAQYMCGYVVCNGGQTGSGCGSGFSVFGCSRVAKYTVGYTWSFFCNYVWATELPICQVCGSSGYGSVTFTTCSN